MEDGELKGGIWGVRVVYREFKGEDGEIGMVYGELKSRGWRVK